MSYLIYFLVPIYVVICIFLILVVLLQQGKGADVASAFGASSTQSTFGARGATSLLEKITTWSFVGFSVLAIAISLVQSRRQTSVFSGSAGVPAKPAAVKPATAPSLPSTSPQAPLTAAPVTVPSTGAAAAPATAVAPAPAAPASAAPATGAPAPKTN